MLVWVSLPLSIKPPMTFGGTILRPLLIFIPSQRLRLQTPCEFVNYISGNELGGCIRSKHSMGKSKSRLWWWAIGSLLGNASMRWLLDIYPIQVMPRVEETATALGTQCTAWLVWMARSNGEERNHAEIRVEWESEVWGLKKGCYEPSSLWDREGQVEE